MNIHNILVTGEFHNEFKKLIDSYGLEVDFRFVKEEEVTEQELQWADVYLGFRPNEKFKFYNMKWVHSLGAGVDGFLFKRDWKEGVLLTRTICSFGQRIAQYSLSYVLQELQSHNFFNKSQVKRKWSQKTPDLLSEKNILIYGTGEIGQEVAKLYHSLGASVNGVSLSGKSKPYFDQVFSTSTSTDHLVEVDIVINTLPLTEKTYNLFNDELFSHMENVIFINVGRGRSVDEDAVLKAIECNHIRKAVLDVFQQEPLPIDSPLWGNEKIVITPHISAVTTPKEAVLCFVETFHKLREGKPLNNQVDVGKGY